MDKDLKLFAVVGAAALLLFFYVKNNAGEIAAGAGAVVADAGKGVVLGIGDAVGIPRTNQTECEKAMAEGRTWDASFACDEKTFLKFLIGMGQ